MPKTHRLDAGAETVHWGYFDAKLPPLLTIDSGDTVTISTVSDPREVMPPPPLVVPAALAAVQAHVQPKLPGHMCTGPVSMCGPSRGDTLSWMAESAAGITSGGAGISSLGPDTDDRTTLSPLSMVSRGGSLASK